MGERAWKPPWPPFPPTLSSAQPLPLVAGRRTDRGIGPGVAPGRSVRRAVGGPTVTRLGTSDDGAERARDRCTMNALFTWVFLLSFKGAVQEMKIYASPEFADIQCTDLLQQVGAQARPFRKRLFFVFFTVSPACTAVAGDAVFSARRHADRRNHLDFTETVPSRHARHTKPFHSPRPLGRCSSAQLVLNPRA